MNPGVVDTPVATATVSRAAEAHVCRGSGTLLRPERRECLAPIDADRPHRTDTPVTVPAGHFQAEVGLVQYEARADAAPATVRFLDLLLKLGLSERLDMEVGYLPVVLRQRSDRSGWHGGAHVVAGESLYLRAKARVFNGRDSGVAVTLAPVISVPLTRATSLDGGGQLLMGAELAPWLDWEVNWSLFYRQSERGDDRTYHLVPCTALTARLFGPWHLYGELYFDRSLSARDPTWSNTFDTGLLWLLANDVQLDAGMEFGLDSTLPPYAAFVGVSWRL